MKRIFPAIVFTCFFGFMFALQAATIFSDDFSDSTKSKINWIATGPGFSTNFSNGKATLQNTNDSITGFLNHNFSTKPSKFTLTVKFTINSASVNGAGLMFCMNNADSLKGYTLQIGNAQNLFVYKYNGHTITPIIPNKTSAYLSDVTNILSISKSSDTFNIFINGFFVSRFNDAQFTSGDIGIVVPPKSTIQIDDVVITDQFTQGAVTTSFADSFLISDPVGWNIAPMVGNITIGARKCVVNDTSAMYSSVIFTDGNFQKASIKAAVQQQSGTGMYGVTWVSEIVGTDGGVMYKTYAFVVDSARQYSIVYPDSPTVTTMPAQSSIFGSLAADTLEVLQYATHFAFKVNGTVIKDTIPSFQNYRIDGAGLYVSPKTSASYSYFIVGGDSAGAKTAVAHEPIRKFSNQKIPYSIFSSQSIVYDILGRKIGVFDEKSFMKAPMVSGSYIVVTKDSQGNILRSSRVLKAPQ